MKDNCLLFSGIVNTVKMQAEREINEENTLREALEQDILRVEILISTLEARITFLKKLLDGYGIHYFDETKARKPSQNFSLLEPFFQLTDDYTSYGESETDPTDDEI